MVKNLSKSLLLSSGLIRYVIDIWGDDRIRSPIEPIFVIFAAYGIAKILKRGKLPSANE
jgi:hypothetical protein